MATRRPIAVVFHRIGPYHHARLRAASGRQELVAIEGCSLDRVYRWDKVEHKKEYPLLTLFEAGDCEDQEVGALRSKVAAALGPVAPAVVMVPGWSSKLALACLEWCVAAATPAVVLSDSTAWDAERRAAKEWIKKKVVRLFSAGLVAGGPHVDYIVSLGLPRERVLEGYDVVDNDYFAHKAKEARRQEEEATPPGVPRLAAQFGEGRLPEKYFMASARFVEKKNFSRLIEAYARYRVLAQRPEFGSRETEDCNEEADCPVRGADDGQRAADPRAPAVTSPAAPWSLVLLGDGPLRETLESQLSAAACRAMCCCPASSSMMNCLCITDWPALSSMPARRSNGGLLSTKPWQAGCRCWYRIVAAALRIWCRRASTDSPLTHTTSSGLPR